MAHAINVALVRIFLGANCLLDLKLINAITLIFWHL